MIKKTLHTVLCLLGAAVLFGGCGEGETGELSVTATNTKEGYSASAVLDGDRESGWIGSRKATESNFQILDIDFGSVRTFSSITLDDSFEAGYTNKRPSYLPKTVSYNNGDASEVSSGNELANVLSGSADGLSWKSENVPTADAPQWLWISLSSPVETLKIDINNEMNNSVPVSYELYYSETPHNRRENTYTDTSTYTLLKKEEAGEDNIAEIVAEEKITVSDILLKIYSQTNEGEAVVASVDEILFYGETPSDYTEEHQPEVFTFMGSNDGKEYEAIVEVKGNYNSVWTYTLSEPVSYRYIRYIIFQEYNNNYPSVGEIIFE
jgi:hypothetical protein